MRIKSLQIVNFRSCDDMLVEFDQYTCLVGQNGAGKSTVLAALNVLFRNTSGSPTPVIQLAEEDFCHRDTSKPICITATFVDLSVEEQQDFSAYVRQDRLIISAKAVWNPGSLRADVKQYGVRLVMKAFAPWFEALKSNERVGELRTLFGEYRAAYPELQNASTKPEMEASLRRYEEAHPDLCEPLDSEDQFYGWSKGENRLRKYFQYVFVPAVKEAQSEQTEAKNSALGELLQRTIRAKVDFEAPLKALKTDADDKYRTLIAERQSDLRSVSSALQSRLREWAHPGANLTLEWQFDEDKSVAVAPPVAKASVGEAQFIGDVSRLGHGLQRSFIVALLQELASDSGQGNPTLLLGIEEPELYQHPPQAQHLAGVLQQLSKTNTQIVVATHSPYFVSGRNFESVRLLRRASGTGASKCTSLTMNRLAQVLAEALDEPSRTPTETMAAIEQLLQPSQRELVFCGLVVLVEGHEDVAFIATHMRLRGSWEEFRKAGGHFVIAEGKTNLSRPLAIANELALPAFLIFDGDAGEIDPEKRERHRRDNMCLLRLSGLNAEEPLPEMPLRHARAVMWHTDIGAVVRADIGETAWNDAECQARIDHGLNGGIRRKNSLLIAATLEALWNAGQRSEELEKLCDAILARPQVP